MKAVKLKGSGEPRDVLTLSNIENLPPPNGSDVVVHIRKRVVHPADYQTIRGFLPAEVFARGGIPGIERRPCLSRLPGRESHAA